MASVLVAYWSGDGQTETVAEFVGEALAGRGHDVAVQPVADAPAVEAFDAVLVGGPVYNRAHRPEIVDFVDENAEAIAARPNGFFQLSLASAIPFALARDSAGDYVDDLAARTGWTPDRVGLFAGAIKYSEYGRLERAVFRVAAALTTGDTDTSRDYEYTDWDDVEAFAAAFAADVEERVAASRPRRGGRLARVAAAGVLVGGVGAAYWAAKRGLRMPEC